MALGHWYYVLLPLVVFAVMALLRFRGCSFQPGAANTPDQYGTAVSGDSPIAWFRLEESSGTTAANAAGTPAGTYVTAPSPLSAGNASWHSPAVGSTLLTLGINNPDLVPLVRLFHPRSRRLRAGSGGCRVAPEPDRIHRGGVGLSRLGHHGLRQLLLRFGTGGAHGNAEEPGLRPIRRSFGHYQSKLLLLLASLDGQRNQLPAS